MEKIILILIFILLFSQVVSANFQNWDIDSKVMTYSFITFQTCDLIQTRRWIDNPKESKSYEINPLVPDNYCKLIPLVIAVDYLFYKYADNLNKSRRKSFLLTLNFIESFVVIYNSELIKQSNKKYVTILGIAF